MRRLAVLAVALFALIHSGAVTCKVNNSGVISEREIKPSLTAASDGSGDSGVMRYRSRYQMNSWRVLEDI